MSRKRGKGLHRVTDRSTTLCFLARQLLKALDRWYAWCLHTGLPLLTSYTLSPGYPVSQSGEEVLCSKPAVCQQHRRLRPAPDQRHCFFSCAHGLPVPPSCFLHSTSTPAAPVHPLHSHCCLQRTMVWSCSRSVGPAAESGAAWSPARQQLPAPGPLPSHAGSPGPDSRAGVPSDQHSAEICQQPRRPQPEDHIGLGGRAGLHPGPTGRRTGVEQSGTGRSAIQELEDC